MRAQTRPFRRWKRFRPLKESGLIVERRCAYGKSTKDLIASVAEHGCNEVVGKFDSLHGWANKEHRSNNANRRCWGALVVENPICQQ